MMIRIIRKAWITLIVITTPLYFQSVGSAHDKIVVVPLLGDNKASVFSPMKTDEAPRSDYFIYSETARDLVTGLEWQRHEASMWTRDWQEAVQYCRDLTLREFSDWRLPTITDLIGITDYTRFAPALSVQAFPDPNYSRDYWSSTIDPIDQTKARTIDVWNGQVLNSVMTSGKYVRCVRAGNSSGTTFIDNNDGTIQDLSFGLMWEKATFGQAASSSSFASSYCQTLTLGGYNNWRVPSLKELVSLVEVKLSTFLEINSIFEYHEDYTDREQLLTTATNATNTNHDWAVRFNHLNSLSDQNGSTVHSVDKDGDFRNGIKCVRNVN